MPPNTHSLILYPARPPIYGSASPADPVPLGIEPPVTGPIPSGSRMCQRTTIATDAVLPSDPTAMSAWSAAGVLAGILTVAAMLPL